MDYKYFSINTSGGEISHIGTVQANNDVDFNKGVQMACEEHFDADVKFSPLKMLSFACMKYGKVIVDIVVGTDDQDTFNETITICQTFLY